MTTIDDTIFAATSAAVVATAAYLVEHPHDWFPCGFAWVHIAPATGPLVKRLKEMNIGAKGYGGGYHVWNPSGNFTQCMEAKLAGAQAYAKVLSDAGFRAFADSRMD